MRKFQVVIQTNAKPPYPTTIEVSASSWHTAAARALKLFEHGKGKGYHHDEMKLHIYRRAE